MTSSPPKDKVAWTPGSWHIPGPSSRYHKRQWSQPVTSKHTRYPSSVEADVFTSGTTHAPARSSRIISPHRRYASLARSNTAPMEGERPLTPVRSPLHTAHIPHDSPFSDYFTDEARSLSSKAPYAMSSTEMQRLLLRINNFASQVLRQPPPAEAIDAMCEKLDELEYAYAAADGSPRIKSRMIDSGFVDDDSLPKKSGLRIDTAVKPSANTPQRVHGEETEENEGAEEDVDGATDAIKDRLLTESQAVLERVSRINMDLHVRYDEMRDLVDQYAVQAEDSQRDALTLKSENERLKADLAFDHSELLYLKLQLKALEVQAGEVSDDKTQLTASARPQRVLLEEDMDQWKSAWEDVDARQRDRRTSHRVTSATAVEVVRHREDGKEPEEKGDWKLDLSRKRSGRIQSITLRRFSDEDVDEGAAEVRVEADTSSERNNTDQPTEPSMTESSQGSLVLSAVRTIFAAAGGEEQGDSRERKTKPQAEPKPTDSRRSTAWQELMESLTAFAGMTDR